MHRHTKIWVIVSLISALVLVPVIPVVAAATAANQEITPASVRYEADNSSQVQQQTQQQVQQDSCTDLTCVSHNSCASQCSVSCSAMFGIFNYSFSDTHAASTTPVAAAHPYILITLASDERPPILFG